ncbi:CoA binding domain-containing protein [Coprinopsis sp. MPI-PUGE-AT-0042]|nr:CoA binding domain-containing protein [Coprinopsis sp. MPI-PUGE-AT-0042]
MHRALNLTRAILISSTTRSFLSRATASTMSASEIKKTFFKSPHFAVVGASKDQTKYGTKILKWYKTRDLDVTPLHPKEAELESIPTLKSISELKAPKETSISVVTPPKVTLAVLQEAKEHGVPAIWIQPGAHDDAVVEYVKGNLSDRVIYDGPCVLVEGDDIRAHL